MCLRLFAVPRLIENAVSVPITVAVIEAKTPKISEFEKAFQISALCKSASMAFKLSPLFTIRIMGDHKKAMVTKVKRLKKCITYAFSIGESSLRKSLVAKKVIISKRLKTADPRGQLRADKNWFCKNDPSP